MSCGMGLIKYLIFIFNFIIAVCGIGVVAVGVLLYLQVAQVTAALEGNALFPSVTLIVIGSIIFVIAFFGCCGAIRESHCMIVTHASFLLVLLLVQIALAAFAFVSVRNYSEKNDIASGYNDLFRSYWSKDPSREVIDAIQSTFHCSGVNAPEDFANIGNGTIPWSCCGKPKGNTCSMTESYSVGCVQAIKDFLHYSGSVIGGVAIGVATVELIGIIFSLCLANSVRNAERRGYRV